MTTVPLFTQAYVLSRIHDHTTPSCRDAPVSKDASNYDPSVSLRHATLPPPSPRLTSCTQLLPIRIKTINLVARYLPVATPVSLLTNGESRTYMQDSTHETPTLLQRTTVHAGNAVCTRLKCCVESTSGNNPTPEDDKVRRVPTAYLAVGYQWMHQ